MLTITYLNFPPLPAAQILLVWEEGLKKCGREGGREGDGAGAGAGEPKAWLRLRPRDLGRALAVAALQQKASKAAAVPRRLCRPGWQGAGLHQALETPQFRAGRARARRQRHTAHSSVHGCSRPGGCLRLWKSLRKARRYSAQNMKANCLPTAKPDPCVRGLCSLYVMLTIS